MPEARTQPWITYALIAANVAMFVLEIAYGADAIKPTPQQIIDLGGSFPPLTLHGEWWRLGSSMFLHFGILHIALNMVCLYQARVVEQLFGRLGFLAIYLLAGLGGGISCLLVNSGNIVSAGASGAVFGVYGAFGAFLVLRRSLMEDEAWQRTARSLGKFLVLNLVIGLTAKGISLSAHIGGLIVGFAIAAALLAGARAAQQRTLRVLGLTALGVAATAVAVMSLKADADMTPVLTKFDAAEHASVTRWNEALGRFKAGELKEPELADALERDATAPYKEMRQELLATKDIPERLRPLFARLDDYTAARIAAWETYVAALRQQDLEKRQRLLDTYKRREADVAGQRAAYEAEIRALKP
jgi:rhomboid protease GluP